MSRTYFLYATTTAPKYTPLTPCPIWNVLSFNGLNSDILGGELFMHLEREGIFMEDTATYGLEFCSTS